MSGSKQRMREKKLSKQPASVQYTSSPFSSSQGGGSWNGMETPKSGHSSSTYGASPGGPSDRGGWVRGHQKDGGAYEEELPKFITAAAFAVARASEVQAMMKAVTKETGSCHVSGAIPNHMRRRAMSHNTKRLPCRLREVATRMREKGLKAGPKKKEQPKSKSRKARRRHGNLLLEFNRRQRKSVWLETHIWHAKRFHMLKKWGYCLGDRPTAKCYRACHRAMSHHCLLQDLSYYCCIELQGDEDKLLACLSQLTSKDTGPTFAAVLALSGRRQGSATVYRAGQYPSQPLGPVTFLWRPRTPGSSHRQLWIWAHPTLKQSLFPELQSVCQCREPVIPAVALVVTPAEPGPSASKPGPRQAKKSPGAKRKRSAGDGEAPPEKKIVGDGTRPPSAPVTWTSASTGIVINDLTMEVVRYRLIGPQSHAVLTEALEAATDCDAVSKAQASPLWWPQHCKDQAQMTLHRQQAEVFQTLKGVCSTGEVPPGTVLGLNVEDPRLALPQKRTQALSVVSADQDIDETTRELMLKGVPEHCCQSSLWDRFVRDNVTDNKLSEQEINRRKGEVLVPGSRLRPTPPQSRVPVLMVQQPGKQVGQEMSGWGAGWDLLLPKGWGMAFWVPLVYRGVRIGGLKMSLKHSQNKGAPYFPHDFPDCPAGACFQGEQETELLNQFKRRPPAKRTNYIKHGCLAPFRCPWQQLVEEWELITSEAPEVGSSSGVEERRGQGGVEPGWRPRPETAVQSGFSVLRNRKSLKLLSNWCRPTTAKGQRSLRARDQAPLDAASGAALLAAHVKALAWVRLSLLSKGRPELHAQVCVATQEDLQRLGDKKEAYSGPLEHPHKDRFKNKVKRRKKGGKKGSKKASPVPKSSTTLPTPEAPDPHPDSPLALGACSLPAAAGQTSASPSCPPAPAEGPSSSSSSAASPANLVLGLWPEPLPSVTAHCSRVTLGWVTQGDFSLSAGCGEALGLVSLEGLVHTLMAQPAERRGLVLLRNPSALHYRWAKINLEA
ncbi:ribonucleases P/MRP protein subunit POP1 isoform X2 [Gadus morhua]|uniref:POP1 homolog, ribonuclease P/MRP subunit n=1 Tax=Gadus morhua TaxID=8049 RepID=A0A8C4YU91_GADMO|nr:ribonucleases P/MRP protein subunit POP1 isoform X2 [Gadus morhua]